jgi:hypothetical protein
MPTFFGSRLLNPPFVTNTTQDRQARILGKIRIGVGEFTAVEYRSACRLNSLCVYAVEAQTNPPLFTLDVFGCHHMRSIAYPEAVDTLFAARPGRTSVRTSGILIRFTRVPTLSRSVSRERYTYGFSSDFPGSRLRAVESAAIFE